LFFSCISQQYVHQVWIYFCCLFRCCGLIEFTRDLSKWFEVVVIRLSWTQRVSFFLLSHNKCIDSIYIFIVHPYADSYWEN
jgi:hypothetical protein